MRRQTESQLVNEAALMLIMVGFALTGENYGISVHEKARNASTSNVGGKWR